MNQLEAAFRHPLKTVPRGLQITGQLASCFECRFSSILGASWVDFWWVWGLKLGAKLTKKSIIWPLVGKMAEIAKIAKKTTNCSILFGPSASQLRIEIDKKASPGQSKIKQKIGQHLDPIFDASWTQLGSILGRFWRPSWSQVGTKCNQNPTPQPIKKIITFWDASGSILGGFSCPSWGVLGGPSRVRRATFLALGTVLAPKCAQDALRGPKSRPRQPPRLILEPFWWISN